MTPKNLLFLNHTKLGLLNLLVLMINFFLKLFYLVL